MNEMYFTNSPYERMMTTPTEIRPESEPLPPAIPAGGATIYGMASASEYVGGDFSVRTERQRKNESAFSHPIMLIIISQVTKSNIISCGGKIQVSNLPKWIMNNKFLSIYPVHAFSCFRRMSSFLHNEFRK